MIQKEAYLYIDFSSRDIKFIDPKKLKKTVAELKKQKALQVKIIKVTKENTVYDYWKEEIFGGKKYRMYSIT